MHEIDQRLILIDDSLLRILGPLEVLRPNRVPQLQRLDRILVPLAEMLDGELLDGLDVGRKQVIAKFAVFIQYFVYSLRVVCGEIMEAVLEHFIAAFRNLQDLVQEANALAKGG